jgi:hypothetical protein
MKRTSSMHQPGARRAAPTRPAIPAGHAVPYPAPEGVS